MDESQRAMWKRIGPVLLTALVPLVAVLGFFTLAIYGKKGVDRKAQPSMAAFDACLSENNLQTQSYATQFDAQIAAEQQMKACGDKIPPALIRKSEQSSINARKAYRDCMEGLVGSRGGRGFGRFRARPSASARQGFRAASATCEELLHPGGGSGNKTKPTPKTPAPGPAA
jgi:hypothetical protein